MPTLDRVFREMEDLNRRVASDTRQLGAGGSGLPDLVGRALPAGAAVMDLVTGQKGVVVGRSTAHVVIPAPHRRND